MKKCLLYLLVIVLLLTSCQAVKKVTETSAEKEERKRQQLISDIEDAILLTDKIAFSEKANYKFNQTFVPYEEKLAEFRSLEDDYRTKLSEILSTCLPELTELLLVELYKIDFSEPDKYTDDGYVSISAIITESCRDEVLVIMSRTVENDIGKLDTIYSELGVVAENWKANLENLSLVGVDMSVDALVKPTITELSLWARDEYFTLLGNNEVKARYNKEK